MSQIYTAAVTLLALMLYFVLCNVVGQARTRYGIKAPAVTGHENFEPRSGSAPWSDWCGR
jgi:hypothetical protein